MPRYFFDFHQGDEFSPDTGGTEFENAEVAYLATFEAAQEMWTDLLKQRCDPHRCFFEVRDQERALLFTVPFREIMEACVDRQPQPLHHNFGQANATFRYAKRVSAEFVEEIRTAHKALKESRALLAQNFGELP